MFNPLKVTLTLMTSGVLALMLPVSKGAIAQEYPGCFMIDSSGQPRNLNNLCEPPLQTATPGSQVPGQGGRGEAGNVPGGEAVTPGQIQTLPDGTTIQTLPDGTVIRTTTGSDPIQTVPGQPNPGIPTQQQVPAGTPTQQQVPVGTPTQTTPGDFQVNPGVQQQVNPGIQQQINPGVQQQPTQQQQINPGVQQQPTQQQQINPGVQQQPTQQQQINPGVQQPPISPGIRIQPIDTQVQ